jgi:hypothetical protein
VLLPRSDSIHSSGVSFLRFVNVSPFTVQIATNSDCHHDNHHEKHGILSENGRGRH